VIVYDELATLQALQGITPRPAQNLSLIPSWIRQAERAPQKKIGSIFTYYWAPFPLDSANSMWLLDFFSGIRFLCVTQPTGSHLLPVSA
jgi:hypothetical protein